MKRVILDQLLAARAQRRAVALITHLESGAQRIVVRAEAAADPHGCHSRCGLPLRPVGCS